VSSLGKWLMLAGALLVLIGALTQVGALGWFGRLPGDIRIERDGFRLYLPIASMIVVSLLLSLLLQITRRWF
jgi:hypothetical protein